MKIEILSEAVTGRWLPGAGHAWPLVMELDRQQGEVWSINGRRLVPGQPICLAHQDALGEHCDDCNGSGLNLSVPLGPDEEEEDDAPIPPERRCQLCQGAGERALWSWIRVRFEVVNHYGRPGGRALLYLFGLPSRHQAIAVRPGDAVLVRPV